MGKGSYRRLTLPAPLAEHPTSPIAPGASGSRKNRPDLVTFGVFLARRWILQDRMSRELSRRLSSHVPSHRLRILHCLLHTRSTTFCFSLPTTPHPESPGSTQPAAQQGPNQLGDAEKRWIDRADCPCFAPLCKGILSRRDFILSSSSVAFFSIIFPFPADSHWLKGPLSWCKSWRWPSTSPPGVAKSILPFQPGDHPPSSQDPSQDKSQLGYCSELPPEDSPPGLLHGPASATITCIILPVVPRDADGLELQGWTSRGEKKTPTVALSIHGCVFVGVFPYSEV